MAGFLFAHFTGEHKTGEQVYFSISRDGLNWNDLNDGKPVLISEIGEKGARDPFIVRDPHSNKCYLIATDLCIEAGKGWGVAQFSGSRNLLVWESDNLTEWSGPWMCEVGVEGAGCVWAPEAVYVEERKCFFVFWASMVQLQGEERPKQRIYSSYTKDFREFTTPTIFMEKENHIIDSTLMKEGDFYYRFSKDETTKQIIMERGRTLEKDSFKRVESQVLAGLFGVEGPEIYHLTSGEWCLIVDRFASDEGYLPLLSTNLPTGEFRQLPEEAYHMGNTKKRHGGILEITDNEYERLEKVYQGTEDLIASIDRKDYDPAGNRVKRIAVRGFIKKDNQYAFIHSNKYGEFKFPGGGNKEGEKLEDTLIREVSEETGLSVIPDSIQYVGRVEEVRKGKYDDIFEMTSYYYSCEVEAEIGAQNLDAYEADYGYELRFVTLEEAISNNDMISDTENIPWIDRDTMVMRKLLQYNID